MRQVEKQTTTYLRGAHLQLTYVVCCHLPTSFPATYLRLLRAPPPPPTHRYGAQWHINRHRQTETIRPTKKKSLHTYCADMVDLTHVLCCVHLHTCCAAYTCTHAVLRTLAHMLCCVHLHTCCAACMHGEYTCILLQTEACYMLQQRGTGAETAYCKHRQSADSFYSKHTPHSFERKTILPPLPRLPLNTLPHTKEIKKHKTHTHEHWYQT